MTLLGFHASHEQIPPSELLRSVQHAERAGFDAAMCSDHFAPWSVRQNQSGFAWAWLGAALQATSLPMGFVCAPGQRYHPAVVAQALGTLAEMFPGRIWTALGSGEALNEHITGDPWPPKAERDRRLDECAAIIRALLRGDEVSHDGAVRVDRARLWTLPAVPPPLIAAAVTATTAQRVASWSDGLITTDRPMAELTEVVDAFRRGGGEDKPIYLQIHVCWDEDEGRAEQIAHEQWRTNVFDPDVLWNLELTEQFDAAAEDVEPDGVRSCVVIRPSLEGHVEHLRERLSLGVQGLFLHHVGQDQHEFIEAFGSSVLPALRASAGG